MHCLWVSTCSFKRPNKRQMSKKNGEKPISKVFAVLFDSCSKSTYTKLLPYLALALLRLQGLFKILYLLLPFSYNTTEYQFISECKTVFHHSSFRFPYPGLPAADESYGDRFCPCASVFPRLPILQLYRRKDLPGDGVSFFIPLL